MYFKNETSANSSKKPNTQTAHSWFCLYVGFISFPHYGIELGLFKLLINCLSSETEVFLSISKTTDVAITDNIIVSKLYSNMKLIT